MDIFAVPSILMLVISLAMFVAQGFAFIDALTQKPESFVAADKLTKTVWTIILGLGLAWHMLRWHPIDLINLVGIVAALVYIVDVRPAIRSLTSR